MWQIASLERTVARRVSRGQALVEFALVLPVLALLLVVAIDFGRVFFGWVSLTNAARIGANYAGYTPNLLSSPTLRDDYEDLIADAVTGCELNPADMNDPASSPTRMIPRTT
jgi:Flp pilus assembly protein TadG